MEKREQYTFTYEQAEERKFKQIMDRLDPDEFTIVEDVKLVDDTDPRYSDKKIVMEMEPEAASTFRFGMKNVKIRRKRGEEEEAAEQARQDRNKVKITVKVDGLLPPTA